MERQYSIIDENLKDQALRTPTVEVIERLFPSHPVRRRGVMRSPFRDDRKPSFSCFRGRNGISMWKDHATGESGDNIALCRLAFPGISYVEAVDKLCMLTLGRSAMTTENRPYDNTWQPRPRRVRTAMEPEKASALKIVSDLPLSDPSTPDSLRDYWRNRGIADVTMEKMGCRYVIFENTNVAGRLLTDPQTGLPILDSEGHAQKKEGRTACIGMKNDIGGYTLREPDREDGTKGFKGCSSSFITTILADGSRPQTDVRLEGQGNGLVSFIRYDRETERLFINPQQFFSRVSEEAVAYACPLVYEFNGQELSVRDAKCIAAVIRSLNAPVSQQAVAVEGMFDGLSVEELNRWRGMQAQGSDLVILNSVGNTRWAVPFICRHRQACIMLDNDLMSGAGQNASSRLREDIAEFCRKVGGAQTVIFDGARLFDGYKDVNDALMACKGFGERRQKNQKKKL